MQVFSVWYFGGYQVVANLIDLSTNMPCKGLKLTLIDRYDLSTCSHAD
jgi:hypothetical protein